MLQFLKNHGFLLLATIFVCFALPVFGVSPNWSPERHGTSSDDPIEHPKDLSGRSVKSPRVRAVHSDNILDEGASAYLMKIDPWLGYQRGRELFLREFSKEDGVFGESGKMAGATLDDQTTKLITRGHVSSCMMCHNIPFRDAGAGATIFKNGGMGRNTPHLFGSGLIEMLGWQIRLKLLEIGDTNRNGFIDKGESEKIKAIVTANSIDGSASDIDFGSFGDQNNDGKPDLNSVCFIWYVDKNGKRISWARSLNDSDVAGYNFEIQVFGWGHGRASLANRIPITSTLRAFSAQAFDIHSGLQAYDNTLNEEPNGDGLALVSSNGSQQFYTGRTRDRGQVKDKNGVSIDDPDRDGVNEELTEGDMDLVEFYQFNHPAPAQSKNTAQQINGRSLMNTIGCTSCHTPTWKIESKNDKAADYTKRYPGDRRFFNLDVSYNPSSKRLEGKLERLTHSTKVQSTNGCSTVFERNYKSFIVNGIYTDFLHHDLGPKFHQVQFDGSIIKSFRTAPLWGVGSSAPYGHDGASLNLDAVIRRHGGEAANSSKAYLALSETERQSILAYLRGLTLYSVDDLPSDINGDGKIEKNYIVSGKDTGIERLNPEWLFLVPGQIEGLVSNPNGNKIRSQALTNFKEAYGINLEYLKDDTLNRFPDKRFAK